MARRYERYGNPPCEACGWGADLGVLAVPGARVGDPLVEAWACFDHLHQVIEVVEADVAGETHETWVIYQLRPTSDIPDRV